MSFPPCGGSQVTDVVFSSFAHASFSLHHLRPKPLLSPLEKPNRGKSGQPDRTWFILASINNVMSVVLQQVC